jgi:hypothetical protein
MHERIGGSLTSAPGRIDIGAMVRALLFRIHSDGGARAALRSSEAVADRLADLLP